MTRKRPQIPVRSEEPMWRAAYTHPDKPHVEVTTETHDVPAERRMFLVGGGPTLLTRISMERINTTNEKESTTVATTARKRPKKKRTREPDDIEQELDDLDVDDLDLDDLDIDDEADLDLDDLDEVDEDEEDEDEDDEEYEDEDEDEEEIEDEDDDDLDLDDLDEEDEEEPAPPPRKARTSAKKSSARKRAPAKSKENGGEAKPLTDAQQRMLKDAKRLKNGAKVENVGQRRTADALKARGLVKLTEDNRGVTRALLTKAGEKVAAGEPAPAPRKAPAAKKSTGRKATGGGNALPRGMVGVGTIADKCGVHEETVRRVLRLNDDRFPKDEELGRYAFDKATAKEVITEVRAYVKYTGGKRGRPAGAYTELPEGKVGVNDIAEMAEVHPNTVYKFLNRHADKFARFKDDESNLYLFTEKQAEKIADKLAA